MKGFQKTKLGNTCSPKVPKRKNGQPLANSLKFLGRFWRKMTPTEKSRYEDWQSFIKTHRTSKLGD